MKLDIGCGNSPREGFQGVDKFIHAYGIMQNDMWDLPFGDNSIDRIYCSHALEHIEKAKIVPTLKEWRRVIKPTGEIEILVPDLEWCCHQWLVHKSNDWWMDILFGNQEHPGEFHKTGFTYDIMKRYIFMAGLVLLHSTTVWSHEQATLQFIMRKDINEISNP